MESSGRPLGRASIEAYAGLIITIIAVVLPMTWHWKAFLVVMLSALIVDLACRSPLTSSLGRVPKVILSMVGVAVIWTISWNPILEQFRLDSLANRPDPNVHPFSALSVWLRGIHGPWIDRIMGAIAVVLAIVIAITLEALRRIILSRKTATSPEKGFLDHKRNAEQAIVKILYPINDLAKIMRGVTASLSGGTEDLERASSTDRQLKVSNSVAHSLEKFSSQMERVGGRLGKLGTSLSEGLEGWSEWAQRSGMGKQVDPSFSVALAEFIANLDKSTATLQSYIDSMNGVKGVSTKLNTAIERHIEAAQRIRQTTVRMQQACVLTLQRLSS